MSGNILHVLVFCVFLGRFGCTLAEEETVQHYTVYGEPCTGDCGSHGNEYYTCTTESDSGYCSIIENTDYKGQRCRDNHQCGKHGKSYTWCYIKAGGWDYCGIVRRNIEKPDMLSYISLSYHTECRDECLYDKESKYFWCNTDKGWDYCSPLPDITYKNEPCLPDHFCATHGKSYTWCRTFSGYDYCGIIKTGECKYSINNRLKDKWEFSVLHCDQRNSHNKIINFNPKPNPKEIADGTQWRDELMTLIPQWKNYYMSGHPRSKVITTDNLRVDILEEVNQEEHQYHSLEIKVNANYIPNSGNITTVAQVLVPVQVTVPSRYVRKAFVESFRRRVRITLEVIEN